MKIGTIIIIFMPVNLEPETITKHKLEESETKYFIHPSLYFFIWFVRLLALRPLLAYCASLG
jgi:hypothetical protein